jgi:hypothetical protein
VLAGVEASLRRSSLLAGPEREVGCRGGWRHEPGGGGAPIWGQPFLGDPVDEANRGDRQPGGAADGRQEAAWIRARLSEKPDITGRELQAELNQRGVEVSY